MLYSNSDFPRAGAVLPADPMDHSFGAIKGPPRPNFLAGGYSRVGFAHIM